MRDRFRATIDKALRQQLVDVCDRTCKAEQDLKGTAELTAALSELSREERDVLRQISHAEASANGAPDSCVYVCDGCQRDFEAGELRHHCTECNDGDICDECMRTRGHDPSHRMILESGDLAVKRRAVTDAPNCRSAVLVAFAQYESRLCLGERVGEGYHYSTFGETGRRAISIGRWLRDMGLRPGAAVAVCGYNSVEWFTVDLALIIGGFVSVPVSQHLDTTSLAHVVASSAITAAFVDHSVIEPWRVVYPLVAMCAFADGVPRLTEIWGQGCAVEDAREELALAAATGPDDLVSVVYTSGSTGMPKGARIPDRIFKLQVAERLQGDVEPLVVFSHDPLSHMSDRESALHGLMSGGRVGVVSSPVNLWADMRLVGPSAESGTPRFWQLLHDEFRRRLDAMVRVSGTDHAHAIRAELLAEFRTAAGPRLTAVGVGGAMVSAELKAFALGVAIYKPRFVFIDVYK